MGIRSQDLGSACGPLNPPNSSVATQCYYTQPRRLRTHLLYRQSMYISFNAAEMQHLM